MKPYYLAHEKAYQEIKSKGGIGWGGAKNLAELGDVVTNQYLQSIVLDHIPTREGKKALDIGCGSGTTAFILAKLGFNVTGVDISETAIAMAQDLSAQQNLSINFKIQDILNLSSMNEKFDLIYDSHCLHCIVFEEDRIQTLKEIKKTLAPNGIFILDTMVYVKDVSPASWGPTLRFDENFILWNKTTNDNYQGIEQIDGQYWCAQRRIYPTEKVMQELQAIGFKVLLNHTDIYKESSSAMLRLVLG